MTQEEKEQFRALYWGQRVLYNDRLEGKNEVNHATLDLRHAEHDDYLLLKSASSITSEDLVKLGFKKGDQIDCNELGWMNVTGNYLQWDEWDYHQIDILRSLGYAVGWKDYTVDELIKEGLIKLQE
jgi:hypothetical protein